MKVKYVGNRDLRITIKNRRIDLKPGCVIEIPDKYADKIRSTPFYQKIFREHIEAEDTVEKLRAEIETLKREDTEFGLTFWARIKAFNPNAERPITIERGSIDGTFIADCYVTERMKELYQAGKLQENDFVVVEVLGGNPTDLIVTGKVFKSWS